MANPQAAGDLVMSRLIAIPGLDVSYSQMGSEGVLLRFLEHWGEQLDTSDLQLLTSVAMVKKKGSVGGGRRKTTGIFQNSPSLPFASHDKPQSYNKVVLCESYML